MAPSRSAAHKQLFLAQRNFRNSYSQMNSVMIQFNNYSVIIIGSFKCENSSSHLCLHTFFFQLQRICNHLNMHFQIKQLLALSERTAHWGVPLFPLSHSLFLCFMATNTNHKMMFVVLGDIITSLYPHNVAIIKTTVTS